MRVSRRPEDILAKSTRSLMRPRSERVLSFRRANAGSDASTRPRDSITSIVLQMDCSGVSSSWLSMPRKRALSRATVSARARSASATEARCSARARLARSRRATRTHCAASATTRTSTATTTENAISTWWRTSSTSSRNSVAIDCRWRTSWPTRARPARTACACASARARSGAPPAVRRLSASAATASAHAGPCDSSSAPGCAISACSAREACSKRSASARSPTTAGAGSLAARSHLTASADSIAASCSVQKRSKRCAAASNLALDSCSRFCSRSTVNQARQAASSSTTPISHGVAIAHGPPGARRVMLAGTGTGACDGAAVRAASGGAAVAADVATVTGFVDRSVSPGTASTRCGKVGHR